MAFSSLVLLALWVTGSQSSPTNYQDCTQDVTTFSFGGNGGKSGNHGSENCGCWDRKTFSACIGQALYNDTGLLYDLPVKDLAKMLPIMITLRAGDSCTKDLFFYESGDPKLSASPGENIRDQFNNPIIQQGPLYANLDEAKLCNVNGVKGKCFVFAENLERCARMANCQIDCQAQRWAAQMLFSYHAEAKAKCTSAGSSAATVDSNVSAHTALLNWTSSKVLVAQTRYNEGSFTNHYCTTACPYSVQTQINHQDRYCVNCWFQGNVGFANPSDWKRSSDNSKFGSGGSGCDRVLGGQIDQGCGCSIDPAFCPATTPVENALTGCATTVKDGSCTYSCKTGYDKASGSYTCRGDSAQVWAANRIQRTFDGTTYNFASYFIGFWQGTAPQCTARPNNCAGTEPTPGANMDPISAGACASTATDAQCTAFTCAGGGTGGSITCNPDGSWTVTDCCPADLAEPEFEWLEPTFAIQRLNSENKVQLTLKGYPSPTLWSAGDFVKLEFFDQANDTWVQLPLSGCTPVTGETTPATCAALLPAAETLATGQDVEPWPRKQTFVLTVDKNTQQSSHLALRAVYKFCQFNGASPATNVVIPGALQMIGHPEPGNDTEINQDDANPGGLEAYGLVEAEVRFSAVLDPDFLGKVTVRKTSRDTGQDVIIPIVKVQVSIVEDLMRISISEDLQESTCTIKIEGLQSLSGDTLAEPIQWHFEVRDET